MYMYPLLYLVPDINNFFSRINNEKESDFGRVVVVGH